MNKAMRAAAGRAREDLAWEPLLELIEEGHVVPVVGEELLTVTIDGTPRRLYEYLAEHLAAVLDVPWRPGDALNAVAGRFVGAGGDIQTLYPTLKALSRDELRKCQVPEPLARLAAIRHFRLFLATTFDDLLVRALDEVRHAGEQVTASIAYSPTRKNDLPCDIEKLAADTVFHLFGRLSAVPEYVVSDEDALEFVHCLQSESRRPSVLFHQLGQKRLLMIGNRMSDWLTRLFLRVAKPEPFALRRAGDYLVHVQDERDLVVFLQHFYGKSIVFPQDPREFVEQLHERWHARNGDRRASDVRAITRRSAMPEGAVFVSYASEDRAAATAICDALEEAGVDTWLDLKEVEPGDAYDRKIRRSIEDCSLFVAIVSRHVLTEEKRFFRKEWEYAREVSKTVKPGTRFLIPVVIDETRIDDVGIPDEFRSASFERVSGGTLSAAFVASVVKHYRAFQRQRRGP
jgi:hypothetical protein